jgi:cob(I)alamin adenosyltransferase
MLSNITTKMDSERPVATDFETELMRQIDEVLSHVWMVRTFLKHSDEAAEDEELAEVHRELYDFMLALGPSVDSGDAKKYLHLARKKFSKLRRAAEHFAEIQPEVSGHMNFKMASKSLAIAVTRIGQLLNPEQVIPNDSE